MAPRDPSDFVPLTPLTLHILLSLAGEDQHGYGLMKEVRERTDGRLNPATGTVYLALQRLEDDGMIQTQRRHRAGEDERRRYYRLTAFGKRVVSAEVERLASIVGLAADRKLLTPAALRRINAGTGVDG